jgi:hypothetical protein
MLELMANHADFKKEIKIINRVRSQKLSSVTEVANEPWIWIFCPPSADFPDVLEFLNNSSILERSAETDLADQPLPRPEAGGKGGRFAKGSKKKSVQIRISRESNQNQKE